MQLFLSLKYHEDHRNRPLVEAITAVLGEQGHRVVNVARDLEAWGQRRYSVQELMVRTFELIDASDVVLVELSEKGVGVGIEAGYGHARGKPVLVAARVGSEVSDTLRGIAAGICHYEQPVDLQALFADSPPDPVAIRAGVDAGFYYRDLLFRFLAALGEKAGGDPLGVLAAIYHRQAAAAFEKIAREMDARGEARDMRALHRLFFNPADEARGFSYRTLRLDDEVMAVEVGRCPLATHLAALELAAVTEPLFCAADEERVKAFNPDLVLERPELLARGHGRCLFRFRWKSVGGDGGRPGHRPRKEE